MDQKSWPSEYNRRKVAALLEHPSEGSKVELPPPSLLLSPSAIAARSLAPEACRVKQRPEEREAEPEASLARPGGQPADRADRT